MSNNHSKDQLPTVEYKNNNQKHTDDNTENHNKCNEDLHSGIREVSPAFAVSGPAAQCGSLHALQHDGGGLVDLQRHVHVARLEAARGVVDETRLRREIEGEQQKAV